MKTRTMSSFSPLLIAMVGALALAGCKKQDQEQNMSPDPNASAPTEQTPGPAAATPEQPAPAAAGAGVVNVAAVTIGNTAAADKSVAPMATLGSKDKIIVSVKTEGSATNANVAAKLVFQDGQTAGELSNTLNTSGADTTNFEFTNPKGWPAGKYTAQVTVNGQSAGTPQTFEVK